MSAFICSDKHISTIALWASVDPAVQQEIANTLKRENIRSFNYRYHETTRFKPCDLSRADRELSRDPAAIVALCYCLDYQSNEHPKRQRALLSVICADAMRACGGAPNGDLWSI